MSSSQPDKLKLARKSETGTSFRLPSNMIGNANNETNCPHKLLLSDKQVSKLDKAFANNFLPNKKFSKTQLSKILKSGGFPDGIFKTLLKMDLPLMKSLFTPLGKNLD